MHFGGFIHVNTGITEQVFFTNSASLLASFDEFVQVLSPPSYIYMPYKISLELHWSQS